MPRIIIATNWYYTGPIQVGSHNYARTFAKLGYEVAFLSAPLSPFHLFYGWLQKNSDIQERWNNHRQRGKQEGNIWHYVPFALCTPYNQPFFSSRFVLNHWYHFSMPDLIKVLSRHGFNETDILWMENPVFHFLLDTIHHHHSVIRLMDDLKGFDSTSENFYRKSIEIANRAETIVYSAKHLLSRYSGIQNPLKGLYLPNGVNMDFYDQASKQFPEEYQKIPEPRILYIGAIEKWFDVNLMEHLSEKLPDFQFILIGPARIDLTALARRKNIHILGPKPHVRIYEFISHAQVGIIPFIVNSLVETVNPLKLFEYMAGGLPVVCTRWSELENLHSPARLADNAEIFANYLQESLNDHHHEVYKAFARNHSWQQRVNTFLQHIKSLHNHESC